MTELYLTDRALSDIDEIYRFSVERWGDEVADEYLQDVNTALARLTEDLSLFGTRPDYTGRLRFYRARKHVLVGDVLGGVGFVVTIWHGGMDFIDRLPRLEPMLIREVELLTARIEKANG